MPVRLLSIVLAVSGLLLGCSRSGDPVDQGGRPAAVAPGAQAAPEGSTADDRHDRKIDRVYVARMPTQDSTVMLAKFPGRFRVADNCLLFDTGSETYVPVFSPSDPVFVTSTSVVSGDTRIRLGDTVEVGGGELGRGSETMTTPPRPERCRFRLLRVAGLVTY